MAVRSLAGALQRAPDRRDNGVEQSALRLRVNKPEARKGAVIWAESNPFIEDAARRPLRSAGDITREHKPPVRETPVSDLTDVFVSRHFCRDSLSRPTVRVSIAKNIQPSSPPPC